MTFYYAFYGDEHAESYLVGPYEDVDAARTQIGIRPRVGGFVFQKVDKIANPAGRFHVGDDEVVDIFYDSMWHGNDPGEIATLKDIMKWMES